MSAPLEEITNTAKVLEGFYTRQADALPIDYMQHDAYFTSLEDVTLSGVSNDIANLAMEARRERHLIPEWRRAIENNMDYNVGSGPPGLARKMDKYCQWVTAGMGEEWFVETGSDDDCPMTRDERYDHDWENYYTDLAEEFADYD